MTLTTQYDPSDVEDLNVDRLRARLLGLRAAWRSAWRAISDRDSGAYASVEMSARGAVHLHALAWCPWIDKSDDGALMTAARRGWPGVGEVRDVKEVSGDGAATEVAKYVTKMAGVSDGRWYAADGAVDVVHPHLAARWEIACYGARVSDVHGVFRGIPKPGPDADLDGDVEHEDRSREACEHCGRVGDWWDWEGRVEDWARLCVQADVRPWGRPWRAPPAGGDTGPLPAGAGRKLVEQLELKLEGCNAERVRK